VWRFLGSRQGCSPRIWVLKAPHGFSSHVLETTDKAQALNLEMEKLSPERDRDGPKVTQHIFDSCVNSRTQISGSQSGGLPDGPSRAVVLGHMGVPGSG